MMRISFKTYPPVAADIPPSDVLAAWRSRQPVAECLDDIASYLQARFVFPTRSGRSALFAILKAALAPNAKVILPGYTCYTVAAAVMKAGMVPVLSDSDPTDLGYDLDDLRKTLSRHPDTRAIVVCHLFGIPLDISLIQRMAGSEVLIIDDAAQAFGIKEGEHFLGAGGHAGFYSFGRGKNLSLAGGGLIVTNNGAVAEKIRVLMEQEFPPAGASIAEVIKVGLYNGAVHPAAFNVLCRLPGIKLGQSRFDPAFPLAGWSPFKVRLLHRLLPKARQLNSDRMIVSRQYSSILGALDGIIIPHSKMNRQPGSLRFPVLIRDAGKRETLLALSGRKGWGISPMYPTGLNGLPQVVGSERYSLKGADYIARSLVTLPTHRWIQADGKAAPLAKTVMEMLA